MERKGRSKHDRKVIHSCKCYEGKCQATIWLDDESTINEIKASKHAPCSSTPRVDNIFIKTCKVQQFLNI